MKYYSQHGEDCLLEQFFRGHKGGFYIDVGAFDGKHLSNTYLFELNGWDGICVEADQKYSILCEQNRTSINICAACVGDPNTTTVKFTLMGPGGLGSGVDVERTPKNDARFTYSTTEVPATTLNKILDECSTYKGTIDLLTIDVEGTEVDVLRGLDFNKHHPRVMVLEANNSQSNRKLYEYVVGKLRYHYAGSVGVNKFYTQTEEDALALRKITVTCHLKTLHPTQQIHTTNKNLTVQVKLKAKR